MALAPVILSIDVGIVNFAFWVGRVLPDSHETLQWDVVDIPTVCGRNVKTTKTMSIEQKCQLCWVYCLEHLELVQPPDRIFIEAQPCRGMGRSGIWAKVFSHVLQVALHHRFRVPFSRVTFVDAKLKSHCFLPDEEEAPAKKKTKKTTKTKPKKKKLTYKQRKDKAVEACQTLEPSIENFTRKKKDDLADAFLMALAYWRRELEKVRVKEEKAKKKANAKAKKASKNKNVSAKKANKTKKPTTKRTKKQMQVKGKRKREK